MFADEKYLTFSQRFWAGLIDAVVLAPFSWATAAVFSSPQSKWALITAAVISYLSYPVYSICMHAMFGKTVGKMIMNIVVLDVSERRLPTFWQAARRDIVPLLAQLFDLGTFVRFVILVGYARDMKIRTGWTAAIFGWIMIGWYALELITMMFNEKRRALHDLIAGTVVMHESEETLRITEGLH